MLEKLDETNFLLYCAKYYDNPQCFDTQEFYDDLNRIKYIKRLFNKYYESGDLRERLILNHIVVLCNVFGPVHASRILFFKLKGFHEYLKPFLEYLGHMPEKINNIGFIPYEVKNIDIVSDS
jgi:hypothetical protein